MYTRGARCINIQMCDKTAVMSENSVKCEYTRVGSGARRIIKADYYEFGMCPLSYRELGCAVHELRILPNTSNEKCGHTQRIHVYLRSWHLALPYPSRSTSWSPYETTLNNASDYILSHMAMIIHWRP